MRALRPPIRGGEDVVWSFADVELKGRRRYNFLVTEWRLNAYGEDLRDELARFGQALEDVGGVVHAYPERRNLAKQQVLELDWASVDAHLHAAIEPELTPFLLIVAGDFAAFDPTSHGWAIVWLPTDPDPVEVRKGFAQLAHATMTKSDLFATLKATADERIGRTKATRGFAFISPDRAAVELADIVN